MKIAKLLTDALKNQFRPCNAPKCYCKMLIDRPDKTKITTLLLKNAAKCKKGNNLKYN